MGSHCYRSRRGSSDSLWELLGLGDPDAVVWVGDALCSQVDPDAFFPERGVSTAAVKAVCLACPVRTACLAAALDNREQYGIWGGTSPRERRKLLRNAAALGCGVAA